MTIPTMLTVLGIAATTLFGIWGVYIVTRKRYPGEITLVVDKSIPLFDTIVKNFPALSLLYQSEPISHGLVLLKGTFLNSGKKDITPQMAEKKITLGLPENFKWLAAKIITSSPNVQASVETDVQELRFSTHFFRCLVLQRYKSSSEVMLPADDTSVNDDFSGGYRHGRQNDYENQTGTDAISAPVR